MIDMDRMIDMELNLQAPVPGAPPGKLELQGLAASVEEGDGARLLQIFQRAKDARDAYVDGIG